MTQQRVWALFSPALCFSPVQFFLRIGVAEVGFRVVRLHYIEVADQFHVPATALHGQRTPVSNKEKAECVHSLDAAAKEMLMFCRRSNTGNIT
jgi:hypothetical protein